MAKFIAQHPKLIYDSHKEMVKIMKKIKNGNKQFHSTDSSFITNNEEADFAKRMNKHTDSQLEVTMSENIVTIAAPNETNIDWGRLAMSGDMLDAENGIEKAQEAIRLYRNVEGHTIPFILENMRIPAELFKDVEIANTATTIVLTEMHGSYLEVSLFVPIFLKQNIKSYKISSLPHTYHKETDEYIRKKVPRLIQQQIGPKEDPENSYTECSWDIIHGLDHTDNCPNRVTNYDSLNLQFEFAAYRLYIIGKIGTASVSCPSKALDWLTFNRQINIIMLHKSCFLETRQHGANIQILSESKTLLQGTTVTLLLAYDLDEQTDWWNGVADDQIHWYFTIATMAITGVLILLIAGITVVMIKMNIGNKSKTFQVLEFIGGKCIKTNTPEPRIKIERSRENMTDSYENLDIMKGIPYCLDIADEKADKKEDTEYNSYFYKTCGAEIEEYHTMKKKESSIPELTDLDIHPKELAQALQASKDALDNDLDLPLLELRKKCRPQLALPPETNELIGTKPKILPKPKGIPAKH